MKIKNLVLRGYRNLDRADITLDPNFNLFVGPNGSGKTNLCESVYFAATGSMFKGSKQQECISWRSQDFTIRLALTNNDIIAVYLKRGKSKKLQINSKNCSQSELTRKLPVLTFVPRDLDSIQGAPRNRRKLIDSHLERLKGDYKRLSDDYSSELSKKNALLKQDNFNEQFLAVLNQRIVDLGSQIMHLRARFINSLNKMLPEKYSQFVSGSPGLQIEYKDIPHLEASQERIQSDLQDRLESSTSQEREKETSVVGPHRDRINYSLNGRNLRKYGSQGEQRSAVIATKLTLLQIYYQTLDEWPLVILDDILSELDKKRAHALLPSLPEGPQVFLTATENGGILEDLDQDSNLYQISEGEVAVYEQ